MPKVIEYRGIEGLVIAEVTKDDNEKDGGYVTGPVESLAPVAEINKTTEHSKEVHWYDNKPGNVVGGEGADTYTIRAAALLLEKLAKITGRSYDPTTGALIEGPLQERYFAMGYKAKDTDGHYRYVWKHKGMFSIPDEANITENNGTEANGTELTYTAIYTNHIFDKSRYDGTTWKKGPSKGLVVSDREGLANLDTFFETVTTGDTLVSKAASGS